MAYVLGFFAADGSMITNRRGAHFIEFSITDRSVLEHIRRAVKSGHRISERKRSPLNKTSYRLQIGSKEWFEDLSRLGFMQNKSKKVLFPPVPKEYLGHFVRGYFDGDGCVYFKKHWSKWHNKQRWILATIFTSGSLKFLQGLHKHLLIRKLSGGYISKKNRGYSLVFSRRDSLALYNLMYHTAPISKLCLLRKRRKLERAIRVLRLNAAVV